MKAYIVLEYNDEGCKVMGVHAVKGAACTECIRRKRRLPVQNQTTYHVIEKNIKELGGVGFRMDGKNRIFFISGKREGKSKWL